MKIYSQSTSYNNVLSLLVPNFVKDLLNKGIRYLAEDQGNVSILFCDICDFDKVMAVHAQGIVTILDGLWRQFDKICADYGLQKIEVYFFLKIKRLDCRENLHGLRWTKVY